VTNIVLVHGAWHGAWTWRRLTPILRARGFDVHCPTLTGLGDRSHLRTPAIDLELHVQDVTLAIESEELSDVVLVGHSYAGLVVQAVAARMSDRMAGVVFMDTFIAQPGEKLFDLVSPAERDHLRAVAAANDPPWLLPPFPPTGYGVTEPADAAWLAAKLDPMPIACFEQPACFDADALAALPQAYIFASRSDRDRFSRFAATFRMHPCHGYHEVASGHDMMLTHPQETADIVEWEARRIHEVRSARETFVPTGAAAGLAAAEVR
jgi:pimeloyl-ACP methyl ester carboxylesterase